MPEDTGRELAEEHLGRLSHRSRLDSPKRTVMPLSLHVVFASVRLGMVGLIEKAACQFLQDFSHRSVADPFGNTLVLLELSKERYVTDSSGPDDEIRSMCP